MRSTPLARLLALSLACAGLSLTLAPTTPVALGAAPQPKPVPTRWEFRVEPGPLRTMVIDTEDEGLRPFFYWTYTVANTTDQDRPFAPAFELVTDQGDILRSGADVPADVPGAIIERLGDPLMLSEIDIQGTLPQGRENARRGVAVWPVTDRDLDEVTVYAAGFSGETAKVTRPDTGEEVILRKSLMLRHEIPGLLTVTSDEPLERTVDRWVMR